MAVNEFVTAEQVQKDLLIDPLDLSGECSRQAAKVYFYCSVSAQADKQVADLKLKLEANEAIAAGQVREAFQNAQPPVKATVDMIKEGVRLHPTSVRLEKELNQAIEIASMCKGIVFSIRDRKDMLVSMCHMDRDERKANIAIMERGPSSSTPAKTMQERLANR